MYHLFLVHFWYILSPLIEKYILQKLLEMAYFKIDILYILQTFTEHRARKSLSKSIAETTLPLCIETNPAALSVLSHLSASKMEMPTEFFFAFLFPCLIGPLQSAYFVE